MTRFNALAGSAKLFLTDGGMETWLFFQQGFEAPEFAALTLIDDEGAKAALNRYFDEFLAMAAKAGTGFVLDTNTWRGCPIWADKLDVSREELLEMSKRSVVFAKSIRARWEDRVTEILVNGVIGPVGDGYSADGVPSSKEAQELHRPQMEVLAKAGVDMFSAITITNIGEAIGITLNAKELGIPVVISFTVETDGRLPSGDFLGEAIEAVDAATGSAPAYYMINCAHPDHFRDAIANGEAWIGRIGGLRANASRLSHAELDECEELDQGDPEEFGHLHGELARLLPNLKVVGGCCGTDHRHVGCVSSTLLAAEAA